MHNQIFQKFMVWRKSQQNKLFISWICSNLYLENRRFWVVGSRKSFSRYRSAIHLDRVQKRMLNKQILLDVSSSVTSGNEQTNWSDMENITYNCTLNYGTCKNFVIVYSFCINVNNRSYFSGATNQRSDKRRYRSNHTNGNMFIETLQNVLLAPDLSDRLSLLLR